MLTAAGRELGVELPALARAAEFSEQEIQRARAHFSSHLGREHNLDIVVCGSMARREMSQASDFDYLVMAHGLVQDATRFRSFRAVCDDWCERRGIRPPGSTGLFGTVVSASELVEHIGLEFDTNTSLTRRILLLEEGVSVLEPQMHRDLVHVMIGRYLLEEEEGRVPGFLLNDVVRYWRTIAVDYQAKIWRDLTPDGWGLRYLKLRLSRKLTFVSAIVTAFLCKLSRPADARGFLVEQFVDLPALARIAQLIEILDDDAHGLDALRRVLQIADGFAAFLDDAAARRAAKAVLPPARDATAAGFAQMRELSKELQECLERVFFETKALQHLSRRYLAF